MLLEANDGQTCSVPDATMSISGLLCDVDPDEAVPLPNTNIAQLELVVAFCTAHARAPACIPKPLPDKPFAELVGDTYAGLMDLDHAGVMGMLDVSKYLLLPQLTELVHAKLAHSMKGKTTAELRAMFDISNDFTPEQEAEIREKYKCFEI